MYKYPGWFTVCKLPYFYDEIHLFVLCVIKLAKQYCSKKK